MVGAIFNVNMVNGWPNLKKKKTLSHIWNTETGHMLYYKVYYYTLRQCQTKSNPKLNLKINKKYNQEFNNGVI